MDNQDHISLEGKQALPGGLSVATEPGKTKPCTRGEFRVANVALAIPQSERTVLTNILYFSSKYSLLRTTGNSDLLWEIKRSHSW